MNKETIKKYVHEYIANNDITSFVEIERIFNEHGFIFQGDLSIRSAEKPQAIFWDGWNDTATEVMRELMTEGKIYMDVCQPMIYVIDGEGLKLPIPKKSNFTRPHWIPVAFSTVRPESIM